MGRFNYKAVVAFLFTMLSCLLFGSALMVAGASQSEAAAVVGTFAILSLLPIGQAPVGSLNSEVLKRLFSNDLQRMLFPINEFYMGCQVDAGVDVDQEAVEVPQDEDGEAQYVVNPTSFPLQVYAEQDSKKVYTVRQIATKPQLVTDLNQALVSYDKRSAKLAKHADTLNSVSADYIAYDWTPTVSGYIRKTTGTDVRATTAPGATGDRKRIAKADIFWAMSLFNDTNIPANDRRLLIPAYMYEDLLTIDEFISSEKLRARGDLSAGQVGEVLGFKIYMRSRTTLFDGSAGSPSKLAVGAEAAGSNSFSALFYHPRFVRYAQGTPKVYIEADRGEYLGTTMNAAIRSGGMISRNSEKGVACLVEAVA